jgi:hypothetical protein
MALANTGDIPLGLTMPNNDKLRALHERRFYQSLLTLIAELKKSTANDRVRRALLNPLSTDLQDGLWFVDCGSWNEYQTKLSSFQNSRPEMPNLNTSFYLDNIDLTNLQENRFH